MTKKQKDKIKNISLTSKQVEEELKREVYLKQLYYFA